MTSLHILLPVKFVPNKLDDILSSYYHKSIEPSCSDIDMDLSLVEWISTEEIAVLFAWIRNLLVNGKKVTVWMPYPYNIYDQKVYTNIEILTAARKILPKDNAHHIERRIRRNIFLLSVWGMFENVGLDPICFKNTVENYNSRAAIAKEKFSHLVIPFTVISATKMNNYYDNPYQDVMNGAKTFRKVEPFELNEEIIGRLESFDCYSPFENKIISNVITKELFANSLIHANKSGQQNGVEECYFALSLNNRWDRSDHNSFINQFKEEKDPDTLDFFKDKSIIVKDFKRRVKLLKSDSIVKYPKFREADLRPYYDNYRNISYLEFTFLDFGDGIHETLKEKFNIYCQQNNSLEIFKNKKPENQLLEYAFFPESSSDQYNSRLETPELFPRGLYFLVDMVRRYKGLLIVRSGNGKLVYDFSDRIALRNTGKEVVASMSRSFILNDAIKVTDNPSAFFDGTMISIILPERKHEEVSYSPVRIDDKKLMNDIYFSAINSEHTPQKIFAVEQYECINMLFLYEQVIRNINSQQLSTVKGFDSLIYITLLEQLKLRSKRGTLIFIDFEYYPRTENISQLLFYLTNSPYINEHSKAIIVNLKDLSNGEPSNNQSLGILRDFKQNLYAKENEPHIFRPIPSINFDIYQREELKITDIKWIGVQDENDEELLTNLLIGKADGYPLSLFAGKTKMEGNAFAPNQNKLHAIFNTSLDLLQEFEKARNHEIKKLMESLIDDGSKPKKNEKPHLFHSAVGSFQIRYLSLYETLHNKYLAKYLAKRLLDAYLFSFGNEIPEKFDKIITVTVSSQLIGLAIRDLIKSDKSFAALKIGSGDSTNDCPSLIMLASYYSFESEKPFKKINNGDRVLIVNDVISTGSLVKKLVSKTRGKQAQISGVMSICDCRISPSDSDFPSIPFFNLLDNLDGTLNMDKYPDVQSALNAMVKKLPTSKSEDVQIRRINPLLNTVVELSDVDAETHRVLFKDPTTFLPKNEQEMIAYQNDYFKIGHFVQNLSHNGYLTEMRAMFSGSEGQRIISEIKTKMDKEYSHQLYGDSDDEAKLFSLISLASQMRNKTQGKEIADHLRKFINLPQAEKNNGFPITEKFGSDFIFYPVFSGIENLKTQYFHEAFGTPYENIIGLQRFETDKGWRFPFPPKRFNNITRNKRVMIFDSGALTGESLIQMIDTISILDVAHIDVVSVVGRVEDFNREFFSRIKSLKVKALSKSHQADENGYDYHSASRNMISFANINIYFGINLHIPVYPSKSNCPFCEEIRELTNYNEEFLGQKFPKSTKEYIASRLSELKIKDFNFDSNIQLPDYIPLIPTTEGNTTADVVSIFLMRDKLGRIDSYRFYKEYYLPFDRIIRQIASNKPETIKQLELIMICILHEPRLYKVHRDLLVGIHDRCKEIVTAIIEQRSSAPALNYLWKPYAMVRLYFIYTDKTEFTLQSFEKLFTYSARCEKALNYLSFILWKGFRNIFNDSYIKKKSSDILSQMSDKFDLKDTEHPIYQNNEVRNVIKSIVNTFEITAVTNLNDAFFNLRKFFFSQSSDNSHSELKRIILKVIGEIENFDLSDDELNGLFDSTINIRKTLQGSILDNLSAIKNDPILRNCDELQYNNLFLADSVYERLHDLIDLQTALVANRQNLLISRNLEQFKNFANELDRFQVEFLLEGCAFVNYCRRYPTDLKRCIDSALNSQRVTLEVKSRKNLRIIPIKERDVFVNAQSDLLAHVFEEIFYNAAHCKLNDDMNITMSLETSGETGATTLRIFQDKPFVENTRINGIDKIIIPILKAFCGDDGVVFEKKKRSYIITITFNKQQLNNN